MFRDLKKTWNVSIVPPSPPPSRWYSHPHIVGNHLSSMRVICVDADADADDDDSDVDGDDDKKEQDEAHEPECSHA